MEDSPSPQNFSKDPENYCLWLYHLAKCVDLWFVGQKIYSNMHPVSCANTHHDVTDLVNHGIVKNIRISRERNLTFLRNKKNA